MPDNIIEDLNADFTAPDNASTLTDTYQVNGSDQNVTFNLIFGPLGVAPMSAVKLDDAVLLSNTAGSLTAVNVGANKDIAGKFLTISTVVSVTSATSVPANITLDFSLTGGAGDYRHSIMQTVTVSGTSVFFSITIFFFT